MPDDNPFMDTFVACLANPMPREEPVRPAQILINASLSGGPTNEGWVKRIDEQFQHDAEQVMQGLMRLPQGTRNRLLILMLDDARVRFTKG